MFLNAVILNSTKFEEKEVSIIWVMSCGDALVRLWSERKCLEFNHLYCLLKQGKNLGFLFRVHTGGEHQAAIQ